jgi:Caspase domain
MRHFLLALGVNVAPNCRPLSYAQQDARRVHEMLTGSLGCVTNSELLLGGQATRKEVVRRLRSPALALLPPEQLTVYFSGHGGPEGIALSDDILTYRDLGVLLRNIGSPHKTIVLDTCHAGSAMRLHDQPVVGFGGEELDTAWVRALRWACPDLRVFAAVGPNDLSREDSSLQGGIFTCAWLQGLRTAPGDIEANGYYFISDAMSFCEADRIIAKRSAYEARPRLISRHPAGTLPLLCSQWQAPAGSASLLGCRILPFRPAVSVRFNTDERRHVATRVEWNAVASTGAVVAQGHETVVPHAESMVFDYRLHVEPAVFDHHPVLGHWLAIGLDIELTWNLCLRDDVGRCLDSGSWTTFYGRTARAA